MTFKDQLLIKWNNREAKDKQKARAEAKAAANPKPAAPASKPAAKSAKPAAKVIFIIQLIMPFFFSLPFLFSFHFILHAPLVSLQGALIPLFLLCDLLLLL